MKQIEGTSNPLGCDVLLAKQLQGGFKNCAIYRFWATLYISKTALQIQ